MTTRAQALSIALVALVMLAAASWFLRGTDRSSSRARAPVITEVQDRDAPILEPTEGATSEPVVGSLREAIEAPAAEERGDEPHVLSTTPDRPGPGQALLKIEIVAQETDAPLAGIELWLWMGGVELAESRQTETSRGLEGDTVVTDAAGRAEFVVVAGRVYELVGVAAAAHADVSDLGPELEPLDEGEERLVRLALRTAWTLPWHVRAVDGETNLPIAGAEVEVLDWENDEPIDALFVLARTTTDGDGRASLRLPAWESMAARVQADGYFWGGCSVNEDSDSFENAALVKLHRPSALTAVVLDASGRPAAGIDVRLHALVAQFIGHGIEAVDWTATTGEDGSCELRVLPSRIELEVELRRAARVLWRPKSPQVERVTLEPGEHRRIEWRFEPTCVLSGALRDQAGNALPRVPLVLLELQPWSSSAAQQLEGSFRESERYLKKRTYFLQTTTDDAGRFSIGDVPCGIFGLGPDKPDKRDGGWGEWPEQHGLLAELPAVVRTICIAPEERAKTVELVLDRGLHIRGQVLGPEGDPTSGTGVYIQGVAALSVLGAMDWLDDQGRFDLGPLVAGRYMLQATPPDPFLATPEPVEASTGEDGVILRFSWGGILRGRVVDEQSGATLEASLFLSGPRHRMRSQTDGEGFRFENLPPGTYDLVARVADGRVGVLRGLALGGRETVEELVVPVAKILTRTQAPLRSLERIAIEWEGVLVWSWWGGEPRMNVFVPVGEIRVSWWALENGVERLVHEERRNVGAGEEASVEYVAPE